MKLESGEYTNPWAFCEDTWLMFANAWLYNRKNSKVYKYATKVSLFSFLNLHPRSRERSILIFDLSSAERVVHGHHQSGDG